MAASDKDVFQKAKAIKFCLATGMIPFYEVNVSNLKELAEKPELLTDIDVLGIEFDRMGTSRTLFDCKTNNKTSPINRAFWAAGVMAYVQADSAYVILKKAASEGHRLSAKSMGIRLFDESLFESHASALSARYNDKPAYAANIDNWHVLHEVFRVNAPISKLGDFIRHYLPLEVDSAKALRGLIGYVRQAKGELDPAKAAHMGVFAYSVFALAFTVGPIVRDFFDTFDPKQPKETFERFLRAYVWGGREQYLLRKRLRELMASQNESITAEIELGGWEDFVEMMRSFLDAPNEIKNCLIPLIELALRSVAGASADSDAIAKLDFVKSNRIRQFCFRLSSYLVTATGLPAEFDVRFRKDLNTVMAAADI
jgi:hypothetical protein